MKLIAIKQNALTLLAGFFALSMMQALQASDLAKEKRWADQVVDSIMDGDAVWLNDGKSKFLNIYTEADTDEQRAAIVMHGTGIHPDWQQIVQPLRVGLVSHNWNTLSIQLPILHNEAEYIEYEPLYDEVAPRIDAAIKYLKQQGNKKIVLIAHSQGASMSAYYLRQQQQGIAGFVAIGMGALADVEKMNSAKSLEKIKLPILDLYGNEDLPTVLNTLKERAQAAAKANNKQYTQKQLTGNHFFDDQDEKLVEAVAAWISALK